jgi:uncharacterized membrane protein YbaN (DUF454 family)
MRKHLREIIGFFLIGVGLIGFLIPIMPSVPFILAGIALIGADNPRLKPLLEKIKSLKERFSNKLPSNQLAKEKQPDTTNKALG